MFGFSVPIFFVLFREATEASVVVSVLATFIEQYFSADVVLKKRMKRLLWLGTAIGLLVSIGIGAAFLAVWFKYANNIWQSAESLWEGCFSLLAAVLITIMAIGFLESENIVEKWNKKMKKKLSEHKSIAKVLNADNAEAAAADGEFAASSSAEKVAEVEVDTASISSDSSKLSFMDGVMAKAKNYFRKNKGAVEEKPKDLESDEPSGAKSAENAMFIIPLITVLREGLEAMVFLGGIGISADPGTIPMAAIIGLLCGVLLGYIIYKAGSAVKLRTFFIVACCFLFFLSSGLLATSVLKFQSYQWQKILGVMNDDTVGVYDLFSTMWYLNCCNPEDSTAGWQFFSAILGWSNQGTYASVSTYIGYWVFISIGLVVAKFIRQRSVKAKQARREARKAQREEATSAVAVTSS
ncbi:high-affinity iron permease [Cladochytrium tenue]|nr:high-affinity iron permease [Cladochytrium tenue]